MRVAVRGTSLACVGLRGNLILAGYHVTDTAPIYTIRIEEDPQTSQCVVDIPDALFGRLVTHAVAALIPTGGVYVQHVGGNLDDRTVVLRLPPGDDGAARAVERGVVRALDQTLAIVGQSARRRAVPEGTGADGALVKHLVGVWDDLGSTVLEQTVAVRQDLQAVLEALRADAAQQAQQTDRLTEALRRLGTDLTQEWGTTRGILTSLAAWITRPRWWRRRRHAQL